MIAPGLRKFLAFGSGMGISIEGPRGNEHLRVAAVHMWPSGPKLAGDLRIDDFRNRPAAEWGAQYGAFASKMDMQPVGATVTLPRHEVILRHIPLPGVSDKDLDAAVAFQLDALHPYDENAVVTAWARLEGTDAVAVAIARREVVEGCMTLFAEAGIKLAGVTCSGVAIHSALRVSGRKPAQPLLAIEWMDHGVELYGESASRPLFSAAFELAPEETPERAIAQAAAELRIEDSPAPVPLQELLHAAPAMAFAAALTSAYPLGSSPLNLLPPDAREGRSAWQWIPTAALATALLLALLGLAVLPNIRNGQYLTDLNKEIQRVAPQAGKAADLDRQIRETRARAALLDQVRQRAKGDMDILAGMTDLLKPPAWVRTMDVDEEQVRLTGEAPQAAPLLKAIDESPLFEDSSFLSPQSRSKNGESFSIRTKRSKVVPAPPGPAVASAGAAK